MNYIFKKLLENFSAEENNSKFCFTELEKIDSCKKMANFSDIVVIIRFLSPVSLPMLINHLSDVMAYDIIFCKKLNMLCLE